MHETTHRRRARRRRTSGTRRSRTTPTSSQLRFPGDHGRLRRHRARARPGARASSATCLTVRLKTCWWWTLGMTWTLVNLRGLEQIMFDMVDNPDGLHRLMAFLRDGHLAKLDYLERNGLLSLNNDGTYVGSGGFGWTHELPAAGFDGTRPAAGHVGLRREPGDGRRLARHVRGVHLPVPAADPGALRAELLRLLRAAGQALARRPRDSRACAASRSRRGPTSTKMAEQARRPLHLLLEAAARPTWRMPPFDEAAVRGELHAAMRHRPATAGSRSS